MLSTRVCHLAHRAGIQGLAYCPARAFDQVLPPIRSNSLRTVCSLRQPSQSQAMKAP